jgi:hypothetical protein
LVLQGFNSATFFTFVMPLSEQYVISLFFILSPPIYVYKEWDILIKISQKLALSSFIGVVAGIVVLTYGKPLISRRP